MGRGQGDKAPEQFIGDQHFCTLSIMVLLVTAITLSAFSANMDDGGSFPHPYFYTGFILGIILIVNMVSRFIVIKVLRKKGLSRKHIVDSLETTKSGSIVWPWSCRVGIIWCVPAIILTAIGGVSCSVVEKEDGNKTVDNTCYYDIEGEHGDLYKGLAIGLIVVHVVSFGYLLLSSCPVQSALNEIKEDPRGNSVAPAPNIGSSSANTPANTSVTPSAPQLSRVTPTASGATSQTPVPNDIELKTLRKQLDGKARDLERKERELAERERQIREASYIPPPPAYSEIVNISN